jgi:hypothetical protein
LLRAQCEEHEYPPAVGSFVACVDVWLAELVVAGVEGTRELVLAEGQWLGGVLWESLGLSWTCTCIFMCIHAIHLQAASQCSTSTRHECCWCFGCSNTHSQGPRFQQAGRYFSRQGDVSAGLKLSSVLVLLLSYFDHRYGVVWYDAKDANVFRARVRVGFRWNKLEKLELRQAADMLQHLSTRGTSDAKTGSFKSF